MDIVVEVVDIKGYCPVYSIGDKFCIREGFRLSADKSLCMHSLAPLIPFYSAISRGIEPVDFGLGEGKRAFIHCPDAFERTGGGTVTFAIYCDEER